MEDAADRLPDSACAIKIADERATSARMGRSRADEPRGRLHVSHLHAIATAAVLGATCKHTSATVSPDTPSVSIPAIGHL